MTIFEALGALYTAPIELESNYRLRVIIEGYHEYYAPVDFKLTGIHLPLKTTDIQMIYDNRVSKENVYHTDIITRMYYPPGTYFRLPDGVEVKVINYGRISRSVKEPAIVEVFCENANPETPIIETLSNKGHVEEIMDRLNRMVAVNEELKRLLPSYNFNMMKYNGSTVEENSDNRILDQIGYYEYAKMFKEQNAIIETVTDVTSITSLTVKDILLFANNFVSQRYPIMYNTTFRAFRMMAITNWFIRKAIEKDLYLNYNLIYLLDHNNDKIYVRLSSEYSETVGHDVTTKVLMPDTSYSLYDYEIKLIQVTSENENLEYNADDLKIYKIDHRTQEKTEIVLPEQKDWFNAYTCILEILSAYIIADNDNTQNYYRSIPRRLEALDSSKYNKDTAEPITEPTTEQMITEAVNKAVDEKVNAIVDDEVVPKVEQKIEPIVKEVVRTHIMEATENITYDDGTTTLSSAIKQPIVEDDEDDSDDELVYDPGDSFF